MTALGAAYIKTKERCDIVRALRGVAGLTVQEIANVVGVSKDTIERHHRADLAAAKPQAVRAVASALFATACDRKHKNHVNAAKFWLATQAKWTTTNVIEVRAEVGGGMSPSLASLSKLPIDQLRSLEEILTTIDEIHDEDEETQEVYGELPLGLEGGPIRDAD